MKKYQILGSILLTCNLISANKEIRENEKSGEELRSPVCCYRTS